MTFTLNNQQINYDKDGYLTVLTDWTPEVALKIAERENLALTEEHWVILNYLRQFYQQYQIMPAMRVLIKELTPQMGAEKGNSVYLQKLFPAGLFRQACKIAGLPKPTRCT